MAALASFAKSKESLAALTAAAFNSSFVLSANLSFEVVTDSVEDPVFLLVFLVVVTVTMLEPTPLTSTFVSTRNFSLSSASGTTSFAKS